MLTTALTTALLAMPAHAAADLETTVTAPSGTGVYVEDTVWITVDNVGNRTAKNVVLTVQLPETANSPTVHVMGIQGAFDGDCTQSGTELSCSLGRIRKGRSDSVWLDIALPQKSGDLEFSATASTTSSESNTANNTDADVADLVYVDVPLAGGEHATNRHCTGTDLTAFYECSLYPSSISSHGITLESGGSIAFDGSPGGYSGSWTQGSDDALWFEYRYLGDVVAEFYGEGVDADCFEGLTAFPGSSWVSPYEVCLD